MSNFTLYRLTTAYALQRVAAVARHLHRGEDGQDIVEYAGMLAIIAVVVGLIIGLHLENTISSAISNAVNSITQNKGSSSSGASHS